LPNPVVYLADDARPRLVGAGSQPAH
jgi:hypothetical protein